MSVILPTYARYRSGQLGASVESVLRQTFAGFELLVVDDGSCDGTADYLEETRRRDPRLVHVRHEKNCGLPALRVNEGIELARGEFIAFQFDDDVWQPTALAALVEGARQLGRKGLVIGRARLHLEDETLTLPDGDVSCVTLYEKNRLTNNSVLLARSLFDDFGMYDPHIVMRRLCDWDLWLRLIEFVPVRVLDEVVAECHASQAGSVGVTAPLDLDLFRAIQATPRGPLLTPARWHDHEIDDLSSAGVPLEGARRRRAYEEHIVPFYLKYRDRFPAVEGFPADLPERRHQDVAMIRYLREGSDHISFFNYDKVAATRKTFKVHYQDPWYIRDPRTCADLLMLVRLCSHHHERMVAEAQAAGRPVGSYLDDDLFRIHEMGEEFGYLTPGAEQHAALARLVAQADAVWVTNETIAESVRPHNPRTIPHLGCVPAEYLPERPPARDPSRPLKVGYAGTQYRIEEFRFLWDALARIADEFGDRVCFEFWGLDVKGLPELKAPVRQEPYTGSYFEYLDRLRHAGFDVLLTPLFTHPRYRLGKSLIKYYELAVAGALGIFSDVPQYSPLPGGLTCLKARNTVEDWYRVVRDALTMAPAEFDRVRAACIAHVRETYTSAAQIHKYEAACRALDFHGRTRAGRHPDGKPRVAFFLHAPDRGGAGAALWRRVGLVRQYGIVPVVVLPSACEDTPEGLRIGREMRAKGQEVRFLDYRAFETPAAPSASRNDAEVRSIKALLAQVAPVLVESVTFLPGVGQACAELRIPHVTTLHAVEDDLCWPAGDARPFRHCQVVQSDSICSSRRWGALLHAERFCARGVVAQSVFDVGTRRLRFGHDAGWDPEGGIGAPRVVLLGTLQPRTNQLAAIRAVGELRREGLNLHLDLHGDTQRDPEYLSACLRQIAADGSQLAIRFRECAEDVAPILVSADVLLSTSTCESFPPSVKEAMAAGVAVVATPAGGTPELVIDGVSGYLCAGYDAPAIAAGLRRALTDRPAVRRSILEQARRVALSELHPDRAANDLFRIYNRTLELVDTGRAPEPSQPPESHHGPGPGEGAAPCAAESHLPAGRDRRLFRRLRYHVRPSRANWNGLRLLVSTHERPAKAIVRLTVRTLAGRLLRRSYALIDGTIARGWVSFPFEPISNSDQFAFVVELKLSLRNPRSLLSVFEGAPRPSPTLFRRLCDRLLGNLTRSGLSCELSHTRPAPDG